MTKAERIERTMTALLVRASYDGAQPVGEFPSELLEWAYRRAEQIFDCVSKHASAEVVLTAEGRAHFAALSTVGTGDGGR